MPPLVIYHNPRCSKSRQTLELIRSCGKEPEIVLYLDNPPCAERIASLCAAMGKTALEIVRSGESLFKDLGLSIKDARADGEWFKILEAHPKLMERPIVVSGKDVVIGRPPENVLDIL